MNINEIVSKYHRPFGESVKRRIVSRSEVFKYRSKYKAVSLQAENHLIKYTINGIIQIRMKAIKDFGRKVWNKIVEIFTIIKDAIINFVTQSKDRSKKIGKLCGLMKTLATKNGNKEHVVDKNTLPVDMSTAVFESRLYTDDGTGEMLEKILYTIPSGISNIIREMSESFDGYGKEKPELVEGQAKRDSFSSLVSDVKELENGFAPTDIESIMDKLAKYAETDTSTVEGKIDNFNEYCIRKSHEIPKAVIITSVSERAAKENSELIATLTRFIERSNSIKRGSREGSNDKVDHMDGPEMNELVAKLGSLGNLQLSTFKKIEKASTTIHLALFKEAAGLYKVLKSASK